MDTVLAPPQPGVLSALGALVADRVRSYSRTVMLPGEPASEAQLGKVAGKLSALARNDLADDGDPDLRFGLDLRYQGQSFELTVPWDGASLGKSIEAFQVAHDRRYSYSLPEHAVQVVSVRLDAVVATKAPEAGAIGKGLERSGSRRRQSRRISIPNR